MKSSEWPLIQCDLCPYQKRFGHTERERERHQTHVHTGRQQQALRARRQPRANQREKPQKKTNMPTP